METVNKNVVQLKWERFKIKIQNAYEKTKTWTMDHKEVLIAVVPAVISACAELGKASMRYKDHKEEREYENWRRRSVYDGSTHREWETNRPMTNRDYRELEKRKAAGMKTGAALEDMGVLK